MAPFSWLLWFTACGAFLFVLSNNLRVCSSMQGV
jgi:hypothetical protein